jgi:hypothetical protein
MLIFIVYGETVEEAEAVAGMLKSALSKAPASTFVSTQMATSEVKRSRGISQCSAIVKNGVVLWEGSCASEAQVLQWVQDKLSAARSGGRRIRTVRLQ